MNNVYCQMRILFFSIDVLEMTEILFENTLNNKKAKKKYIDRFFYIFYDLVGDKYSQK